MQKHLRDLSTEDFNAYRVTLLHAFEQAQLSLANSQIHVFQPGDISPAELVRRRSYLYPIIAITERGQYQIVYRKDDPFPDLNLHFKATALLPNGLKMLSRLDLALNEPADIIPYSYDEETYFPKDIQNLMTSVRDWVSLKADLSRFSLHLIGHYRATSDNGLITV